MGDPLLFTSRSSNSLVEKKLQHKPDQATVSLTVFLPQQLRGRMRGTPAGP
jgi:hypothetical protein